jgi:hypothetical protein
LILASAQSRIPYGLDNVVTQKFSKFMGNESITYAESTVGCVYTNFTGLGSLEDHAGFFVETFGFWPHKLDMSYCSLSFMKEKKKRI